MTRTIHELMDPRRMVGALVALILLISAPAVAQTAPPLPARVTTIVQQLHARNLDLAHGDDEARRALTRKIVEQIVFEFPADGYGWKSADEGRPPSKDCFARQVGNALWCWDWQDGATRAPFERFQANLITGQHFIAITGVDHLGGTAPNVPPTTLPPMSDTQTIAELRARLAVLERLVAELTLETADIRRVIAAETTDIRAIIAALPIGVPYRGSLIGIGITSRPCPGCRECASARSATRAASSSARGRTAGARHGGRKGVRLSVTSGGMDSSC